MIKYLIPIFLMLPLLVTAQNKKSSGKFTTGNVKTIQAKNQAKAGKTTSTKPSSNASKRGGQGNAMPKVNKERVKSLMTLLEDYILENSDDAHAKQVILGERQLVEHVQVDENGMVSADNAKEIAERYLNAKRTKEAYIAEMNEDYQFLLQLRDGKPGSRGANAGANAGGKATGSATKPSPTKNNQGQKSNLNQMKIGKGDN